MIRASATGAGGRGFDSLCRQAPNGFHNRERYPDLALGAVGERVAVLRKGKMTLVSVSLAGARLSAMPTTSSLAKVASAFLYPLSTLPQTLSRAPISLAYYN